MVGELRSHKLDSVAGKPPKTEVHQMEWNLEVFYLDRIYQVWDSQHKDGK